MVAESVVELIRRYLDLLLKNKLHVTRAILFGSHARDEADKYSDIDLVVPSDDFDPLQWKQDELLWVLTGEIDTRIEPIACSNRKWLTDDVNVLLEIARREGIVIPRDRRVRPYSARREFEKQS